MAIALRTSFPWKSILQRSSRTPSAPVPMGQRSSVTHPGTPHDGVPGDMTARETPKAPDIEVERKFKLHPQCQTRLVALGARLMGHVTFTDRYVDTSDLRLSLSDFWLRQRDTRWQLKYKPSWQTWDRCEASSTQYQESESEEAIQRLVAPLVLGSDAQTVAIPSPETSLESFLRAHNFEELATFQTSRKSYTLDGLRVDLDQTDFDYGVGEVEIMVRHAAEVDPALDRIAALAAQLGELTDGPVPGKVDVYLHARRRDIYDRLMTAGLCFKVDGAV